MGNESDFLHKRFVSRLLEKMVEKGYSKEKLCKELAVSHSTYENWISSKMPQWSNFVKIAKVLDVDVSFLISDGYKPAEEEILKRDKEGYLRLTGRSVKTMEWDLMTIFK